MERPEGEVTERNEGLGETAKEERSGKEERKEEGAEGPSKGEEDAKRKGTSAWKGWEGTS